MQQGVSETGWRQNGVGSERVERTSGSQRSGAAVSGVRPDFGRLVRIPDDRSSNSTESGPRAPASILLCQRACISILSIIIIIIIVLSSVAASGFLHGDSMRDCEATKLSR